VTKTTARAVIDRSGLGMTPRPLSAQHRNRTGYDRCQSGCYVHGDKRQKERSVRRKGKTGDIGRIPDQRVHHRSPQWCQHRRPGSPARSAPSLRAHIIANKRSRRGVSKIAPKLPVVAPPTPEPEPQAVTLQDRLARLRNEELLVMLIHFALPHLSDDARAILKPLLEFTRPIVEAASEKMGRRAR